ncbi:MAG: LmbE family N-acetylglucosaminyl deacetylase [Planctomycetota bacterium]|jgi:LmbE family N-acetylglucosaminyl deacetylase
MKPSFASSQFLRLLALLLVAACHSGPDFSHGVPALRLPGADVVNLDRLGDPPRSDGPRVLCVTAHPDDEIAFAGVIYKTVTHLGGVVDLCVITDGQGGFKYSSLAESIYGLELTEEEIGRAHLPAIRRAELARGCAWLGVSSIVHLNQPDHRYTQAVEEVLGAEAKVWDLDSVRATLDALLRAGDYDALLVLTPTPGTHAHHKAASLLAAEAVDRLAPELRPAVLCVRGERDDGDPEAQAEVFGELEGWPLSKVYSDFSFRFDRRQPFGFRQRLDYTIIANWAIAEHKSQGTMQLLSNGTDREVYSLLEVSPRARAEEVARWFARLAEEQFEAKIYSSSAGTNAVAR